MKAPELLQARKRDRSTLVYWHCEAWWAIEDGPSCTMAHKKVFRRRENQKRIFLNEGPLLSSLLNPAVFS
jgi:hypothetical protein